MADPISLTALALAGIGTAVQVAGTIAQGNAQATQENYRAAQANQAAGQARATAQRDAENQQRTARFALSTGQARAAASGADPMGGSTENVEQNVAGQGEYNYMTSLFNGEEKARGLQQEAATDQYQGSLDKSTANIKAIGTIANSGSSMLMKYGTPFDSEDDDLAPGGVDNPVNASGDSTMSPSFAKTYGFS